MISSSCVLTDAICFSIWLYLSGELSLRGPTAGLDLLSSKYSRASSRFGAQVVQKYTELILALLKTLHVLMDDLRSLGHFPLVGRSAGLSSEDKCSNFNPSFDLISFNLLVTTVTIASAT